MGYPGWARHQPLTDRLLQPNPTEIGEGRNQDSGALFLQTVPVPPPPSNRFWSISKFSLAKFHRKMAGLEEKVMEGLVKKLGMEKEEVEKAHITFVDKHPEGQMTRFDILQ